MAYQTTNTRCLIRAAKNLGLTVRTLDQNSNFVSIEKSGKRLFFVNYSTPFDDPAAVKICKDKEFAHFLLEKKIRMPMAKGYFDPLYSEASEIHGGAGSYASIAGNIMKEFTLPLIIKPNSRSRGRNVCLCSEGRHVYDAIEKIFDHDSEYYDYVALVEDYVAPHREFRVIVFKQKILLVYEKNIAEAKFIGNLSPLHWDGARAVVVKDEAVLQRLGEFIAPIFNELKLDFTGLDVILGRDNKFYLIELNTSIGFAHFVKDNGDEPIVDLYRTILSEAFNL
ncbi:MAG: hypothetical protein HYV68_01370 [Candidatus Taylorbacteria bacterium]|nr:hypothetical protein [Candidatus Taylorbacteria bacterium]